MMKRMAYDDIFKYIGSFGLYQKRVYVLQTLPVIFAGIQTCLSLFILFAPAHRCSLPGVLNDTYKIQGSHHHHLINKTIPLDLTIHSSIAEGLRYSKCEIYGGLNNGTDRNSTTYSYECMKWVFEKTEFESTFTTQGNLVCRKKLHRTHAMMAFMAGFTIGSIVIGIVSDRYGRKKGLMLSIVIHFISNIAVSFTANFIVFVILRLLSGISVGGLITTTYVMDLELVGPKMRMWAGMIFQCFWGVGVILLSGVAAIIRDWRYLNLAVSLPTVLFLSYYWFIPESARWLTVTGRHIQAEETFKRAAKMNKRDYPEKLLVVENEDNSNKRSVSLMEICSSPKLLMRTVIICLNWMVVAMEFSGLSLNVGNLGGNVYLNFFLTSLAEVLGFVMCMPLLNRIGRKPVYVISFIAGGIALILTIFPVLYANEEFQWVTIALSIIGKIGASAAFGTIFLYSAEFFPTVIRNSAMGVCNIFARSGGMVAPYVVDLTQMVDGNIGKVLPMTVFGSASFVVGLLSLCLPETLNKRLPETIEDTINFDRKTNDVQTDAKCETDITLTSNVADFKTH